MFNQSLKVNVFIITYKQAAAANAHSETSLQTSSKIYKKLWMIFYLTGFSLIKKSFFKNFWKASRTIFPCCTMPSLTFCTRLTSGQKIVFSQVVNQWLDNCRQKPYFILNRMLHEQGLSSKVWSSNHSFLYVSLDSLHTEATGSSGHTCWCCHLGTFEANCHLDFHCLSLSAHQAVSSLSSYNFVTIFSRLSQ